MKKSLLILVLLAGVWHLHGEVFLLRPLNITGGGGNMPLIHALPGLENTAPLLTEPLTVNGKKFLLELYRSNSRFEDILNYLKAKGGAFALSNDTLRCAVLLKDKTVERLLVVKSPGRGPVTVFRILGSPGLPPPGFWPRRLPDLPPGARALQVIELPRQKSIYASFDRGSWDAAGSFRVIDNILRARGWEPAGKEASPLTGGTGDIYVQKKNGRILWVTLDNAGRGAFYCRN